MALKNAISSLGTNLRFYSPSIDSPLFADWKNAAFSSFSSRNPRITKWEEIEENISKQDIHSQSPTTRTFFPLIEKQFEELANVSATSTTKSGFDELDLQMGIPINEFESSPYAQQISDYLQPFFSQLKEESMLPTNMQQIISKFKQYSKDNSKKTRELKELMKVKELIVPYLEVDLPSSVILKYSELDEDDPLISAFHYSNSMEDIRELRVLIDRYDTKKEVLCILIWSNVDNTFICRPSVELAPYPLCWSCNRSFGMHPCTLCGVAKYCSKECQELDWKVAHKTHCDDMLSCIKRHKLLTL